MIQTARQQQRHVVAACYLGWTLDAFDFFVMTLVFSEIAQEFHTDRTTLTLAITITLAMRAVGAFLFGRAADRWGRRPTLMANVLIYSLLEFASGFAPSLTAFLVLRALYGVAMGGEWGVGASLTMESIPGSWRGAVSGLLQAGYPSGFLLATVVYRFADPLVHWRGMFMIGALPALLVLYVRRNVPESPDWVARAARRHEPLWPVIARHVPLTLYAVLMMTAFNFFSHGTQDLYRDFLGHERHLPLATASTILIVMNIGAILGGLGFGIFSQRFGRRAGIVIAALLSLPVLPLWAFATTPVLIGLGAFLMQVFVQGAWGIVPAHLNELSPPEIRATFPGFVYQLGNFLASANATIQSGIAAAYFGGDLSWALAGTAGVVAVVIALLAGLGKEARHVRMGRERDAPVPLH
jgi:SHS family lactate transporter-like MFS transporter